MGIDVTLVETGRLPACQIGSTAFALSGQFPIAPSEIEHTKARDSGLAYGGLSGSPQRTFAPERPSGHGTSVQELEGVVGRDLDSSGTEDLVVSDPSKFYRSQQCVRTRVCPH